MLLRIGAIEYEPSVIVKKHTLDERLIKELHGNKIYDLKERVKVAKQVLTHMEAPDFAGFKMEEKKLKNFIKDDKTVVPGLQLLITPSYRGLRKWMLTKSTEEQIRHLKSQLTQEEKRIVILSSSENSRVQGGDWEYVENSLILRSQLVCCTLSMAGIKKMNITKDLFDYLIIDEACQCTEPATLIPF